MKMIRLYLMIFTVFLFLCNQNYAYEKLSDGILLKLKKEKISDPALLKIQVCTGEIIRVIASPVNEFSTRQSLMVEQTVWDKVEWDVTEKENWIELTTSKITVKINSQNGSILFYDKKDNLILNEKHGGGKFILPAEVMGESTYNIRQIFDSSEDEAFYGLGAHQNGIMNYKGEDVDLWQYNIVNAMPFLLSNKNYGILWDNNSRTKFGDIREYESISSLKLFDKNGNETGLTAEYFNNDKFNMLFTEREESRIEHEYIDVNDDYPEGFEQSVKSVRWSGEIECNVPGLHKFRLYSSGYIKVWLDGKLMCDAWRQNWLPWTHIFKLEMEKGKRYPIVIEWIHTGGYIGFKYLPPDQFENKDHLSLWSEVGDQIDYYFIYGKNPDEIIKGYRLITGKTPMMPKWSFGFWQSREHYKTQEELLSVVKEFRDKQIPIDNIVQDWFYWKEDQWGSHEFDPVRFPDPKEMIEKLHNELHTRIMISVWPKFYAGTKHYDEFNNNGWLYKRNVEKGQKDWVGQGYVSTFYDPYLEEVRNLYWKQIDEKLFKLGIDAWWLDSTEPDIQSNLSLEETALRLTPTGLGTYARYRNTFSLMNAKGVYEGQRKSNPDKRVFILTRSAFPGQQRYASATWSGDVASRWYDLKIQTSAGLNFSLSGIPYWTCDIGGFSVEPRYEKPNELDLEEWQELNTRWFQFGTFLPLFRVHGQFPYREIFNIAPDDHPAYQAMLYYNKLRYRLMPYIYSLAGMVTHNHYTIMRALMMDFGYDKKVTNIGDQYMFGPAFLINPVSEYKARERTVYLPSNVNWYELRTGNYYEGGQTIRADAPYSDIPIFIKEGSIIPCGPEIFYTDEKPTNPIRLFVYTGKSGSFTLYEDENVNYNYEKGEYSQIVFYYDEDEKKLTIGDRTGEFPGMLTDRIFEIIWINKNRRIAFDFNIQPDEVINYNGTEISIYMKQ